MSVCHFCECNRMCVCVWCLAGWVSSPFHLLLVYQLCDDESIWFRCWLVSNIFFCRAIIAHNRHNWDDDNTLYCAIFECISVTTTMFWLVVVDCLLCWHRYSWSRCRDWINTITSAKTRRDVVRGVNSLRCHVSIVQDARNEGGGWAKLL